MGKNYEVVQMSNLSRQN